MPEDLYAGIADRYHLFYGKFGEYDAARIAFFRQLFKEHGVRTVLDCACGTGHDLPMFLALGCEVEGSDISDAMLAQACQNLTAASLDVPLHKLDYRKLPGHFGHCFDAVVCLSSSILHMPSDTEALRALQSMCGVLRDGGILVLTQGTSDRQWQEKPRFILALDNAEMSRLFVIDYFGKGARYNILDIFHGKGSGELRVWSTDYPNMLLCDDHERLLREAGFATVDFYGDYDFAPYDKATSQRLITVAQR